MAANHKYVPTSVAELSDGSEVTPESQAEEDWLNQVANNPTTTPEQKDRIARFGTLFSPTTFDVNFSDDRRKNYPTDLDPQLRQMIRES